MERAPDDYPPLLAPEFSPEEEGVRWIAVACGVFLMLYRIPIACCIVRRAPTLLRARFCIGWIVTLVVVRLFTDNLVCSAALCSLGAVASATLSEWLSVHAVAAFLGALIPTFLLAIPYTYDGMATGGSSTTIALTVFNKVCFVALVFVSAIVVSTLYLAVPAIAKTWEGVGVPILGGYACVSSYVPDLLLTPFTRESTSRPWIAWASIALLGILIQWLCRPSSIDIDSTFGEQNDIVRSLLADESVSASQLFQSRFPTISKAMNDQGGNAFSLAQQGMQLPRGGEPLSERQIKLLQACKEDPEQRDRLLFGGGLY